MALKMSSFVRNNEISVLVNFPGKLDKMKNTVSSGYVLSKIFFSKKLVRDYLLEVESDSNKVEQSLLIVKLDIDILDSPLNCLTIVETEKVELAYLFLLQSKVIVVESFFTNLIYNEKQYFMRLFRNLVQKKGKSVILIEDDMDFICEYFKKFILFTTGENYKVIDDFYLDEIYKYVNMPKTVELIKYLEIMGHKISHEITFNETLKAIYRGVS